MDEWKRLKRFLIAGAALGAAAAIVISLLLDVLYADVLQGTWRDAIVNDLKTFLGASVEKGSLLVSLIFIIILSILGLFGAFVGTISTFFVYKFLSLLVKK